MKNELNLFTNGYMPWYPRNWWDNIKHFFRAIKLGWQRATKGYSDYDTWDLDIYYSRMMIASLSQFRAEVKGYPAYMESIEDWYAILDKIIFLLKQANEDEPLEEKNELAEWYEEHLETRTLSFVEVKNGVRKYVDNDDEETKAKVMQYYKREGELDEIRKQKRKEAFELLAEYFGHLWW
jgi:hypothetical protein